MKRRHSTSSACRAYTLRPRWRCFWRNTRAVTLKGPVNSDEEKQTVASKAAEVVGGPDKVTNQLTVKQ